MFIYTTLLKTHFSGLSGSLISQLVQTAVQIHIKLQNIFIDNKDRRHYTFTSTVLDATLKYVKEKREGREEGGKEERGRELRKCHYYHYFLLISFIVGL